MTQQADAGNKKRVLADSSYSVDFLYTIVDSIADPLFVKDEQHRWVVLNQALLDWLGRPLDELLGKTDYDLFSKSEADVFWEQDNKVFASDQPIEHEELLTDNEGVHRMISTKKIAKQLPDGQKLIVGTIRDITDRKKAEEIIAKKANQLQVAFEVFQATASLVDPGQLMQYVVDLISSSFNLYYVGLFLSDYSARLGAWGGRAVLQAGSGEAGREMVKRRHELPLRAIQ